MSTLKELNDKLHAVQDSSTTMSPEEMSELIFKQNGVPNRATVQVDPSLNIFDSSVSDGSTANGKTEWDKLDPRAVSGSTMDKLDLSQIASFGS